MAGNVPRLRIGKIRHENPLERFDGPLLCAAVNVGRAARAMRRGENPSDVVEAVKEKMKQIQHGLPEGIQLHLTYDRSELVNYTIKTVGTTIFEGISLVLIFLIFFMF